MKAWQRIIGWVLALTLFIVGLCGVIAGRLPRVGRHGKGAQTLVGLEARVCGVLLVGLAIYWMLRLRRGGAQ